MAEKYYSILTNRGKELEAQSSATGVPVIIKDFVVGDGNGQAVMPDPAQTKLVREVYRNAISGLQVSPDQANQFIAQLVLPIRVGGFVIREVGLLTDAGELYSVANSAAIEKPENGVSVNLQYRLAVSETANIELKTATGDGLFLRQDANLGDVRDAAESRKNIGLKGAAVLDVGDTADTVAAGDDTRIVNALQKNNNLSELTDKEEARKSLELKSAATKDVVSTMVDTTAGKIPVVGWLGLSKAITIPANTDLASYLATAPGAFYHCDSSTGYKNAPNFGANWFDIYLTIHETTNYRTMIAISSTGQIQVASITSGYLSGWRKVYSDYEKPTPGEVFPLSGGIANAANLNDYTAPGLYYQPANAQAAAGTNYPEAIAGSLEVYKHAGITQIYRVYNNSRSYIRTQYTGTWTAWVKQYDAANKPTAADVGALASNGNAISATKLQTARTIGGVGFDGTANINLPGVNTQGNQNTTGNAATATRLQTARTINGVSFNGTANINIPASSIGSYTKAESDGRFVNWNYNSIGSVCLARFDPQNQTIAPNATTAGANLHAAGVTGYPDKSGGDWMALRASGTLSGTWRCLGFIQNDTDGGGNRHWSVSLFVRIA